MRKYEVTVNGVSYEVEVEEMTGAEASSAQSKKKPVKQETAAPMVSAQEAVAKTIKSAGGETITSPMPGTILEVSVKAGASVKKGELMFILEAMKLENEIFAPIDGTVSTVNVAKGASVNSGDVLCIIS